MEKFVAEILVIVDQRAYIVRVIENDLYEGEALSQLRVYDGKTYAYVAERNLSKFLKLLSGN